MIARVLLVSAVVVGGALALRSLFLYPIAILLSADPALSGTVICVDGAQVLTVTRKTHMLRFRAGWHTVEARSRRFGSASLRFEATDDEQGSRMAFLLGTKRGKVTLQIE